MSATAEQLQAPVGNELDISYYNDLAVDHPEWKFQIGQITAELQHLDETFIENPNPDLSPEERIAGVYDWYTSLGTLNSIDGAMSRKLFRGAAQVYADSTGNLGTTPIEAMLRGLRGSQSADTLRDPADAILAGTMIFETARQEPDPARRNQFYRISQLLFQRAFDDPRSDLDREFGGRTRLNAEKYLFDIKFAQLNEKAASGSISDQELDKSYKELAKGQGKAFLDHLSQREHLSDGEIREQFITILTRFAVWQDETYDKLLVLSATPRQDMPSRRLGRVGSRFAFDASIVDGSAEAGLIPLQVKAYESEEDKSEDRYDDSMPIISGEYSRRGLGNIVQAIMAHYANIQTPEQEALVKTEIDKVYEAIDKVRKVS